MSGRKTFFEVEYDTLKNLARLYWYTVEFGLIQTPEGLRHYGAGIVSSFGEAQYSLEDKSPHHIEFDLMRIMKTNYKIDDYQDCYFVINSFDQLFESTQQDFDPLYRQLLEDDHNYAPQDIITTDNIIQKGTLEYSGAR